MIYQQQQTGLRFLAILCDNVVDTEIVTIVNPIDWEILSQMFFIDGVCLYKSDGKIREIKQYANCFKYDLDEKKDNGNKKQKDYSR